MTPRDPLYWTIKKFENGWAVLEAAGKQWQIPRSQVPANCQEGDVLTAEFFLQKDEKKRKENLAKALLEELLGKE